MCVQGMALIHWACDRGHLPIAELLVGRGADVNMQVRTTCMTHGLPLYGIPPTGCRWTDTSTLWSVWKSLSLPLTSFHPSLPLASSCDQCDVVTFLLSNGADPTIKDCDDLTPMQVAGEPSTKQLFQTCSN